MRNQNFAFSCAQLLTCVNASGGTDHTSSWYTRYRNYPPYCSTPNAVLRREIPLLQKTNATGDTSLLHVSAIMRHGARTPWGNDLNCWSGYHENPATGVWNCNLTAYLSPPPPERAFEEGDELAGHSQAMFLFEKRYDALATFSKEQGFAYLSNALNGTCQVGQLIMQGYEQELQNGKFLRKAYVDPADGAAHMQLMQLSDKPWEQVYYRVDDEARTLMSGQMIFRGMLGPEMQAYFSDNNVYPVIPLHTADYDKDVMDPNLQACPRLAEIVEDVKETQAYKDKFVASEEAKTLIAFQREVLRLPRADKDMDTIDCLMTTMCTDRPLPDAVNDYGAGANGTSNNSDDKYGTNLFERLVSFDTEKYTHVLKANDVEFAKVGIGPLWVQIMSTLEPHTKNEPAPTLAVFSGHDTTIMPILAALDPDLWPNQEWPPYASMIVLELHNLLDDKSAALFPSTFAFRLIYNGKVITPKMTGCPPDLELCDFTVLQDRVDGFDFSDANCQRRSPVLTQPACSSSSEDAGSNSSLGATVDALARTKDLMSTSEGKSYITLLVSGGAFIGALLTSMCFASCSLPRWRRRNASNMVPTQAEDDLIWTLAHTRYREPDAPGIDDTDGLEQAGIANATPT